MRVAGSEEAVASSAAEGSVVAVGSGEPMKAFQVALKTMKEGEKTKLKIKPECEHGFLQVPSQNAFILGYCAAHTALGADAMP